MIARLLRLSMKGFRRFGMDTSLPLDADVVLVYGPNGSGKSSLLNAIEFGLTGHVRDLEIYRGDYPRSLRNAKTAGPAEVALTWKDGDDQTQSSHLNIRPDDIVVGFPGIAADSVRFFQERCYLSQPRLTRLLENYQTPVDGDSEVPLVRFVRELLRLDVATNLVDGLTDALDIRRLRKRSTALTRLDANERDVARQQQAANEAFIASEVRLSEARALLEARLADVQSAEPLPSPDEASRLLRGTLEQELSRVRDEYGRLQSLRARLASVSTGTHVSVPAPPRDVAARLSEVASMLARIDEQLEVAAKEALVLGAGAGLTAPRYPKEADPAARARVVHSTIASLLAQIHALEASRADIRKRLDVLEQRLAAIDKALADAAGVDLGVVASRKDQLVLLQRALAHVGASDTCPVCARDFGDLHTGTLATFVKRQISALGGLAAADEAALHREGELRAERDRVRRELAAAQAEDDQLIAALAPERIAGVRDAAARIGRDIQLTERRGSLVQAQAVLQNEEARARTLSMREEWSASEVLRIASDLGGASGPTEATSESLMLALDARSQAMRSREEGLTQALVALGGFDSARDDCDRARRTRDRASAQSRSVAAARTRLEAAVAELKAVSKAATETIQELVGHVFSEELNGVWSELFSRLATTEVFSPRLTEPRIERHHILVSAEAVATGVRPFAQLASVLSAGNLNTAALSLFVALHLVERPRMRILLLDDPVQSMDDVHVIQLAALLRALVRQQRRQVVLAVHERALYDFLYNDLGPSREGLRLIGIELGQSLDPWRITVHESREDYVSDGLPL